MRLWISRRRVQLPPGTLTVFRRSEAEVESGSPRGDFRRISAICRTRRPRPSIVTDGNVLNSTHHPHIEDSHHGANVEELHEISRRNGAKSRGTEDPRGQGEVAPERPEARPPREPLPLPNEDPAAVEARNNSWNDYYRPESPVAHHLVNQCARATLLSDRCRHLPARGPDPTDQPGARSLGPHGARTRCEALKLTLEADPARSVRHLKRTAFGCAWLIERAVNKDILRDGKDWDADEMRAGDPIDRPPTEPRGPGDPAARRDRADGHRGIADAQCRDGPALEGHRRSGPRRRRSPRA